MSYYLYIFYMLLKLSHIYKLDESGNLFTLPNKWLDTVNLMVKSQDLNFVNQQLIEFIDYLEKFGFENNYCNSTEMFHDLIIYLKVFKEINAQIYVHDLNIHKSNYLFFETLENCMKYSQFSNINLIKYVGIVAIEIKWK